MAEHKEMQMTIALVSIIVPVYKVREAYLRQCIESITNQTFHDLEIILIDDGSPDNCGTVCDEYATNDSRIVVIHQENQGVSAARNAGLDAATGKWVMFVDSDDWIERDMCEKMAARAETQNLDVLICALYKSTPQIERECRYPYLPVSGIITPSEKECLLLCVPHKDIPSEHIWSLIGVRSSCAKLMQRGLIESRELRFPVDLTHAEDSIFCLYLFFSSERIGYINQCFYHYRATAGSATNSYNTGMLDKHKRFLAYVDEFYTNNSFNTEASRTGFDIIAVAGALGLCRKVAKATSLSFYEKRHELARITSDDIYRTAMRRLRKRDTPTRPYLQMLLLKHGCYCTYILLMSIHSWKKGCSDLYA